MRLSFVRVNQPARPPGQQRAVPPLVQTEEGDIGKAKPFIDPLELLPMPPVEPTIRCGPYISPPILQHAADELVRQTVLRAEGPKTAVLVVEQSAAVGGHPERPVSCNLEP